MGTSQSSGKADLKVSTLPLIKEFCVGVDQRAKVYFIFHLKDFAWENQRGKPCYISHIAPETCLDCCIANIASTVRCEKRIINKK